MAMEMEMGEAGRGRDGAMDAREAGGRRETVLVNVGSKRKLSDWDEWWSDAGDDEEAEVGVGRHDDAGIGAREADAETGHETAPFAKYFRFGEFDDAEESCPSDGHSGRVQTEWRDTQITCSLAVACAALAPFTSRAAYKLHCRTAHSNQCTTCKRILPTRKLLDLHIAEIHDAYFRVLAEKDNAYECFVDGCQRKCSGPFKRKLHLMDKHQFPASFNFHVILGKGKGKEATGSAGRRISSRKSPSRISGKSTFNTNGATAAAAADVTVLHAPANTTQHSLSGQRGALEDSDMVMELVNVPDCPKAAATSTKKKNHRKPKMKPQAGAAVSPANGIGYVKDKEDACAKELTQDDHNTGITPAALQQPAMPQQQQQQQDTPMDEDPFASLVGSLKRLSLVPRSVTTRSGTNAPTKPTPHAPPASATSLPIVLLAAPACPGPATGAVVTAKTPPHATHGPAIQSPVKSLGAAAAGGGNGMWARERVLAAYRAAVPDRAHEAERMWKERRAVRKAAWNAEVLAAAGGRVDVEEGDGEGMDVEDVGESD